MTEKLVAFASDHAGFDLKEILIQNINIDTFKSCDLGTHSNQSVDYPDFGVLMGEAISTKKVFYGVLICGSGIGMSIAANRFSEVRAALVHNTVEAKLARQHNDANILCFGARLIEIDQALDCLKVFLTTKFLGGRHNKRVEKLSGIKHQ